MMPQTLKELLAPATEADLLAHTRTRRVLHLAGADPGRFSDLFSLAQLEGIIARRQISADDLRVFMQGRRIDLAAMGVINARGDLNGIVLQSLGRQGASFALNHIEGTNSALWRLARDVERRLGERVSIATIVSFSSATALPLHYDPHDLLILQLTGDKHWSFFGEPVAGGGRIRDVKHKPTDVTGTATMRPGDVLFVPAGLHHQCRPQERSLHLALLIKRQTGQAFVDHLREKIDADLLFDEPMPRGQGPEVLDAYERTLKARIAEILQETSLSDFFNLLDVREATVTGLDLLGCKELDRAGAMLSLVPSRPVVAPSAGITPRSRLVMQAAVGRLSADGRTPVASLLDELGALDGPEEARRVLIALIDQGVAHLVS
jgi:hypothetical protein